jgi:hypothetical protein
VKEVTQTNEKPVLDQALERLTEEVRDGLRHGHFELTVVGEIVKGKKRGLTIKAGKSHRFTIPEEAIESPNQNCSDP